MGIREAAGKNAVPIIIAALAIFGLATVPVAFVLNVLGPSPAYRAAQLMVFGLIFFWVAACGALMFMFRGRLRSAVLGINLDWRLKFVLFAALLALIEEAITVSLTNLAPVLGVPFGSAYITASGNYLDVVLFHSVILFVPQFIAIAWLLSRYDFSPAQVFLLYGAAGVFMEGFPLSPFALLGSWMWVFVYGLMVYLPAYCVPDGRGARKPGLKDFLSAFALLFLAPLPMAFILANIHPIKVHFLA
jgi:hypothetical protein